MLPFTQQLLLVIPSGSTVLEQGDSLLVLADRQSLRETRPILHLRPAAADTAPAASPGPGPSPEEPGNLE